MTRRQPDARATAGQQLEDEADAITDTVRRQTVDWQTKLMRGHPGNARIRAAIVSGLIGGALDVLWDAVGADPEKIREIFIANVDAYLDASAEDQAADAEPQAKREEPGDGR